MAPAGGANNIIQLVPPWGRPQVLGDTDPFMKGSPENIIAVEILDNTIFDFLFVCFLFKGAEHLVPYDKDPGIVAIKIAGVGGVMDPVVRGCIHYRFKPCGHAADRLGMNPILVNKIYTGQQKDQRGRKTQKKKRHAKDKAEREETGPCLPQGGGEIIMSAAVMDNMCRPEPSDPVRRSVKPVIGKIIQQKSQRQKPYRIVPAQLKVKYPVFIDP